MLTIEQTVQIGNDRRIHLDMPPEVPVGEADIVVVVNPKTPAKPAGSLWDFYGSLEKSENFKEDPVEIQKRLRNEWER